MIENKVKAALAGGDTVLWNNGKDQYLPITRAIGSNAYLHDTINYVDLTNVDEKDFIFIPKTEPVRSTRAATNAVDDCGNCEHKFMCSLSPHYRGQSKQCLFWSCCYDVSCYKGAFPSQEKYQNDSVYHAVVDEMVHVLEQHHITQADMREAVGLAITIQQQQLMRNQMVRRRP